MAMFVANGGGESEDGGYQPMAEINITPMVDVMLVLLVIFMVAAPLMMAGVPVELPHTTASRVSNPHKPMIVSLTAKGEVYVRDNPVSDAALIPTLEGLRAKEGDTVVYVRADKSVAYGKVMDILGKVGQSGYGRVSLLSQPKPGGNE
jgi:biopolymer transport protein TolR